MKLKKCPICGGKLVLSDYYQISHEHAISKNGKILKKYTVTEKMPINEQTINCTECDFQLSSEEFWIDEENKINIKDINVCKVKDGCEKGICCFECNERLFCDMNCEYQSSTTYRKCKYYKMIKED